MSTIISDRFQPFVQSLIASGRFQSEAEVVDAALSQFQASQGEEERLRMQLEPALERLDRGEGLTVDRDGLRALRDQVKSGAL